MKNFLSPCLVALFAAVLSLMTTLPAAACAACYGDTTGSKMGIAADWGIIAMVIIMLGMLGAVAGFGFYLAHRAKHPLPDYEELLSEDGGDHPSIEPTPTQS